MAHMAADACMWSGQDTSTASMLPLSLSNMRRKSWYFGAVGWAANILAARLASGSVRATMFSLAHPAILLSVLRSAPTVEMLSFSLGDLNPAAFNEGALPKPAAGAAPASRVP